MPCYCDLTFHPNAECQNPAGTNAPPLKRFALIPSERSKPCTDHSFRYTGTIPCTGPQVCYLCGTQKS